MGLKLYFYWYEEKNNCESKQKFSIVLKDVSSKIDGADCLARTVSKEFIRCLGNCIRVDTALR